MRQPVLRLDSRQLAGRRRRHFAIDFRFQFHGFRIKHAMAVQDFRTAQNDVQAVETQRFHTAMQMAAELGDDDIVDEQVRHGEMAVHMAVHPVQTVRLHLQPYERLVTQLVDAVQSFADFLQFRGEFWIRCHGFVLFWKPFDELTQVREPSVYIKTDSQCLALQTEHKLFVRFKIQLAFSDNSINDGIMMKTQHI